MPISPHPVSPGSSPTSCRRSIARTCRWSATTPVARSRRSWLRITPIAWAPEDSFFKLRYAERLAAEIPNARLVRIEDSRTFVSEDQPEQLAEEIAAFVSEPAMTPAE